MSIYMNNIIILILLVILQHVNIMILLIRIIFKNINLLISTILIIRAKEDFGMTRRTPVLQALSPFILSPKRGFMAFHRAWALRASGQSD